MHKCTNASVRECGNRPLFASSVLHFCIENDFLTVAHVIQYASRG